MVSGRWTAPTGLTPRLVQPSAESADAVTAGTTRPDSTLPSKTATVAAMPVVAATRTTTSGMDMMVASAECFFWFPRRPGVREALGLGNQIRRLSPPGHVRTTARKCAEFTGCVGFDGDCPKFGAVFGGRANLRFRRDATTSGRSRIAGYLFRRSELLDDQILEIVLSGAASCNTPESQETSCGFSRSAFAHAPK
jgi:hypothetical protein